MSVRSRTILFAGGGSGGHLFPAVAVADELITRRSARGELLRPYFLRSGRTIEETVLKHCEHEHSALPLDFSKGQRNPFKLVAGYFQSRRAAAQLIGKLQPAVVVGLAGRASIPVLHAANAKKIPTLLLEPNLIAGRATKLLARRARAVCLSFEQTVLPTSTRTIVTGNPVRRKFVEPPPSLNTTTPTLLILGGSQGARFLNQLMVDLLPQMDFPNHWNVVHQTGPGDAAEYSQAYENLSSASAETTPFIQDMHRAISAATIVVSRGGATTLAEIACLARPTIVVPYPGAVSDHQVANARFYEHAGGAITVLQNEHAHDQMRAAILELVNSPDRLLDMSRRMRAVSHPQATVKVTDEILKLID